MTAEQMVQYAYEEGFSAAVKCTRHRKVMGAFFTYTNKALNNSR